MQRVTVKFDLIFDLRRRHSSLLLPRRTEFGFTADGVSRAGLWVPSWPRLQVGDTITALLRKKDDWQSLIGWVNHETGEISSPTAGRTWRRAALLALAVGVLAVLIHAVLTVDVTGDLPESTRVLLGLLWGGYGLLLVVLAIGIMMRALRRRRDLRALEQCLRELRESGVVALPPRTTEPAPASPPRAAKS